MFGDTEEADCHEEVYGGGHCPFCEMSRVESLHGSPGGYITRQSARACWHQCQDRVAGTKTSLKTLHSTLFLAVSPSPTRHKHLIRLKRKTSRICVTYLKIKTLLITPKY